MPSGNLIYWAFPSATHCWLWERQHPQRSPGTGALPQAQPGGGCPWTPRVQSRQDKRQNKTKHNIWTRVLSTNTHKANTVVTHKGEANFSFLSQWKGFWNPGDAVCDIMCRVSCNPTCAVNYQQPKLQINTKKTFKVQSLSHFCSKSYSCCTHLFSASIAAIRLKEREKSPDYNSVISS